MGAKAQVALDALKALTDPDKPHGLTPLSVIDDAPKVAFPVVKLVEPPNYKLGDKVCVFVCMFVRACEIECVCVSVCTCAYVCLYYLLFHLSS